VAFRDGLARSEDRANRSSRARQKAGRSEGIREDTRFPSTTTSWSTHRAPAFTKSSRMEGKLVTVRPRTMPAEAGTHPAWQMKATGFPASWTARTNSTMARCRRMRSGA